MKSFEDWFNKEYNNNSFQWELDNFLRSFLKKMTQDAYYKGKKDALKILEEKIKDE
jgi:hypothetical protein